MERHPLHIKNPELQNSHEVSRAVEQEERRTEEKIPNDPAERIEAYLRRLETLVFGLDTEQEHNLDKKEQKMTNMGDVEQTKRPRAVSLLREMILNEYVRPNKDQMAQGAARVEGRAARDMGIEMEYDDATLEQRGEIAVGDLESSLDQWIKYLSDPNEPYPTWFRYYVFRNILNLGEYDKDRREFPKRSRGTFKLFPDVDRGALAYVEQIMSAAQDDAVLASVRQSQKELGTPEVDMLTPQKAQAFAKMAFARQYAEGVQTQGEITPELRAETRGEWVHYRQNEDPKELWKSLQNKGTAWCTRGYPTAETQLKNGDFHVYYTLDAMGQPTIPRVAIRMDGESKIAEPPRGVFDSQQNLEPSMIDILDEKLKEFGSEAEAFRKKSEDMRRLTALEQKKEKGDLFTREDLLFLYEINSPIEGFGYQRHPRIAELRNTREAEEDMLVMFECTKDQIAHVPSEINEHTKVYVGQIEPGIFPKLPETLENIYSSFPDDRIRRESLELGGKSREQLISELQTAGVSISERAKSMMDDSDFVVTEKREEIKLVRLTVASLGFGTRVTSDQIHERAVALGLELCPPDTGPNYSLKYKDCPINKLYIGMKQIGVHEDVFGLSRDSKGLLLDSDWERPGLKWDVDTEFVFRFRQVEA